MNQSHVTVYYYTNEIAKQVGHSNATILRWAEELSVAGYHFERDEQGGLNNYRFKEEDLEVFQKFKEYRNMNYSLPTCASKVIEDRNKILTPITKSENIETEDQTTLAADNYLDELVELKLRDKVEPFLAHLTERLDQVKQLEEKMRQLPPPPSQEEIRRIAREEERLRARISFDVKTKLREKATKLWYEKPEKERTIKLLFKRIENEGLKNEFIRSYIDQHYQEEIDKCYEDLSREGKEQ
ncbi:hypothetical protein [Brevibacillus reuszeri]|uniref:hypothetical protein n=1 Tax=Brevibacillus reuszeri TaxID=54915 RepID=UPI000CCC9DE0|nr:hypothetical protein [Brevibacillus reuszeri]